MALAVALLMAGALGFFEPDSDEDGFVYDFDDGQMQINGETISVEIATTSSKRAQGLSGQPSLPDGTGMLFVFDEVARHGFWMKDMNFSIDIVWLGRQGQVVHIEPSVSPDSFPDSFRPDKNALYVVELPAGFSQNKNIKIGDEFTLPIDL